MTDWQQQAACRHPSVQPTDFDTALLDARGRLDQTKARTVAARVCGVCPVRAACLAHAVELAANGLAPQELLWAGLWWPANPYRSDSIQPQNLLADLDEPTSEGVAA